MKGRHLMLAALICVTTAIPVTANAATCEGTVQRVSVLPAGSTGGILELDWGYGQIKICNLASDQVSPAINQESCKAIYALAMTGLTSGKQFGMQVNANTGTPPVPITCADLSVGGVIIAAPVRSYLSN
jgi:hypothetical protein